MCHALQTGTLAEASLGATSVPRPHRLLTTHAPLLLRSRLGAASLGSTSGLPPRAHPLAVAADKEPHHRRVTLASLEDHLLLPHPAKVCYCLSCFCPIQPRCATACLVLNKAFFTCAWYCICHVILQRVKISDLRTPCARGFNRIFCKALLELLYVTLTILCCNFLMVTLWRLHMVCCFRVSVSTWVLQHMHK